MAEPAKKLSRAEWLKTSYATSKAEGTQNDIERLLARYGISEHLAGSTKGPNGRPSYGVRFVFRGAAYVISCETLEVAGVPPDQLLRQAKRCVFHWLKAAVEQAAMLKELQQPPEKAFFAYLETPSGFTVFDAAAPCLARIQQQGWPALPMEK